MSEIGPEEQKKIIEEYSGFFETALQLAERDLAKFPLGKEEYERERFEKHLIGMMELYSIRYGDPSRTFHILSFIERKIFNGQTDPNATALLYFDKWLDLRKSVMDGEYLETESKE